MKFDIYARWWNEREEDWQYECYTVEADNAEQAKLENPFMGGEITDVCPEGEEPDEDPD